MVILKRFLVAVSFPAILVGCAGPEITTQDVELERASLAIERENRLAQEAEGNKELNALSKLDATQLGMAFMAKQMKDVVVAVLNKDNRKKAGFYDMKIAIASQQNALAESLTGKALRAATTGGAIWAATDVVKHGMDKAGDKVTMTGDNNATEINRVSAKSKTTTSQIGDANSTGPSDAQSNGPDKSSTVTEVVAPEEPVVEEPVVEEGEFVPTEPPAEFDDEPIDIPEVPVEESE